LLRVTGRVDRPLLLHEDELSNLPHQHLAVTDEEGRPVAYDGIAMSEILGRAGTPLGKRLRGARMNLCAVVRAADGYSVVFDLTELDPDFTDRVVLLADWRNGQAIGSPEGPLRLIGPADKRHARCVREVKAVDVEEAR
jgi:DMSO/TMAO reductase YedYZ molybdopterin-dependent catalytic subunit